MLRVVRYQRKYNAHIVFATLHVEMFIVDVAQFRQRSRKVQKHLGSLVH